MKQFAPEVKNSIHIVVILKESRNLDVSNGVLDGHQKIGIVGEVKGRCFDFTLSMFEIYARKGDLKRDAMKLEVLLLWNYDRSMHYWY